MSPYGFQSGSLFIDPNGKPEEKYKMIYVGLMPVEDMDAAKKKYTEMFGDALDPKGFTVLNDKPYVKGLYGAVSPDGIHWKCIEEPLMVQPSDTLNTCVWDAERQAYIAYIVCAMAIAVLLAAWKAKISSAGSRPRRSC
ncbi:MAG: hypothetical protein ACOX0K_09395 [Oscillospiraceae bacterium]